MTMLLVYDVGYKLFFWFKRMRKRFPKWTKAAQLFEYYFSLFLNFPAMFQPHFILL